MTAYVPGFYGITKRIVNLSATDDECWIVATRKPDGYAVFGRRPARLVHRIAWTVWHGEIPAGHEVHHECRSRSCVNPAHLRLLTESEHTALHHPRRDVSHPPAGTCRHGHDWATFGVLTTQGKWVCTECGREACRRHDAKRRAH